MLVLTAIDGPARPPTPPKDHACEVSEDIEEALKFLDTSRKTTVQPMIDTPPSSSPTRAPPSLGSSVSNSSKCLRFELTPTIVDDHLLVTPEAISLRQLPPSREQKSSKSILKNLHSHSEENDASSNLSSRSFDTLDEMLYSVLKQLESESRGSRLDAYNCLANCLRTFDGRIDGSASPGQYPALERHLRRDLSAGTWKNTDPTQLLTVPAIGCVHALLASPQTSTKLSREFWAWFVNETVALLESPIPQKELAKKQGYLLTLTSVAAEGLSAESAERLINALHNIEQRVIGGHIRVLRLLLYRRIIGQMPHVALRLLPLWLPHVFSGMMSTIKDIRENAVEVGFGAAMQFGTSRGASQAVRIFLERTTTNDVTQLDQLEHRLVELVARKAEGVHQVPPIWTLVIMWQRHDSRALQHWPSLARWIGILSFCFNSSDLVLQRKAFEAWNYFIYAIKPNENTPNTLFKSLCTPMCAQFDRIRHPHKAGHVRAAAFCSLNLLYFYAFRPGSTEKAYLRAWDQYVRPVAVHASAKPDIRRHLCQMLIRLLGNSSLKLWNEEGILKNLKSPVSYEDISHLPAKFIRANFSQILDTCESLFFFLDSESPESQKSSTSPEFELWYSLLGSIVESARLEVRVSLETRRAVLEITRFLLQKSNVDALRQITGHQRRIDRLELSTLMFTSAVTSLEPSLFCFPVSATNATDLSETLAASTDCAPPRRSPISQFVSSQVSTIIMLDTLCQTSNIFLAWESCLLHMPNLCDGSEFLKVAFEKANTKQPYPSLISFWDNVLNILDALLKISPNMWLDYEDLLCAGLLCDRNEIVEATLGFIENNLSQHTNLDSTTRLGKLHNSNEQILGRRLASGNKSIDVATSPEPVGDEVSRLINHFPTEETLFDSIHSEVGARNSDISSPIPLDALSDAVSNLTPTTSSMEDELHMRSADPSDDLSKFQAADATYTEISSSHPLSGQDGKLEQDADIGSSPLRNLLQRRAVVSRGHHDTKATDNSNPTESADLYPEGGTCSSGDARIASEPPSVIPHVGWGLAKSSSSIILRTRSLSPVRGPPPRVIVDTSLVPTTELQFSSQHSPVEDVLKGDALSVDAFQRVARAVKRKYHSDCSEIPLKCQKVGLSTTDDDSDVVVLRRNPDAPSFEDAVRAHHMSQSQAASQDMTSGTCSVSSLSSCEFRPLEASSPADLSLKTQSSHLDEALANASTKGSPNMKRHCDDSQSRGERQGSSRERRKPYGETQGRRGRRKRNSDQESFINPPSSHVSSIAVMPDNTLPIYKEQEVLRCVGSGHSSATGLVQDILERLAGVREDCKKLLLGGESRRIEREKLNAAQMEVQKEIEEASRRVNIALGSHA